MSCWDDMHRISASLKDGTVTAVLLTSKLQALDNKNLIHRGLEEYGRILYTMDVLTFLSDQPHRRKLGRMLNKLCLSLSPGASRRSRAIGLL